MSGRESGVSLKLIEVHREDIASLPTLLDLLKDTPHRVIVFCDDLSFDHDDTAYKSLKAALDGGVEGRPDNVLFYATSNRRHLLPRHMMENEQSTAINPSEAVEEKVSLSDRFGLWLGFHKCSQEDYLTMIDGYADHFKLSSTARRCMPKRWNGQRRAGRAPAAWPGSIFRIWPGRMRIVLDRA
jgi:predicted AAA+ superfamily ATPase